MTIPEAVQLVIQAAAFGESGDALVLDMGTPVRIIDVAQQLIDMSHKQIEITFTGLRSGEKLHEDLFGSQEVHQSTRHQLITRVSVPAISLTGIRQVVHDTPLDYKKFQEVDTKA
jgi:dTDP-glucose 4,6-dehydratase